MLCKQPSQLEMYCKLEFRARILYRFGCPKKVFPTISQLILAWHRHTAHWQQIPKFRVAASTPSLSQSIIQADATGIILSSMLMHDSQLQIKVIAQYWHQWRLQIYSGQQLTDLYSTQLSYKRSPLLGFENPIREPCHWMVALNCVYQTHHLKQFCLLLSFHCILEKWCQSHLYTHRRWDLRSPFPQVADTLKGFLC